MMNIFNLFQSKTMQLAALVAKDDIAVAVIKNRQYDTVQRIFVTDVTIIRSGFNLLGWTDAMMSDPSVGCQSIASNDYKLVEVKPISAIKKTNNATPAGYRAYVESWCDKLCYDEKLIIMYTSDNVPISLRVGSNITHTGFTAEKPFPTPERPDGVSAVHISWAMLPYLPVTLDWTAKPVPVENFIYYEWMGDKIRDEAILESRKIAKMSDIEYRIKAFQEKHADLQRELAELFKLIRKEK
jgi:hypothetical protein